MFPILKTSAGIWKHGDNEVFFSDWDIAINGEFETYVIEARNGANLPAKGIHISEVPITIESVSSTPNIFTDVDAFIAFLKANDYPPLRDNTTPQPLVKVWTKGDAISINRTQTWIDANFDNTGLGINEMIGWAKRNGQNGTRDAQDRSLLNQGTKFANVGIFYGFENTVLVAHDHDSIEYSDGKKGVNTVGKGATVAGRAIAESSATDKANKTSKDGKTYLGAPSTVETGVGKNYHPILVELFIERVEDLWIMGGSAIPSLPDVIKINGRIIKYIDTSDTTQCPAGVYTFVLEDSWSYLYFYGNTPIDAVIPDDFYDVTKGIELQGDIQTNANVTMRYNGSVGIVPITSATADIRFNANQVEANIWVFGLSTSSLGGGVQTVTGDLVDNTDPSNPIIETPNLTQVLTEGDLSTYTVPIPNNTFVTFDLGRELTENYFTTDDVGTGGVFLDKDVMFPDNATIRFQAGYVEDNVTPTDVTLLPYRFTTDAYVFYQGARVTDITIQPEDVCTLKWGGNNSTDGIQIWFLTIVSKYNPFELQITQTGTSAPLIVSGSARGLRGATITPTYVTDGHYHLVSDLPIFANAKDFYKNTSSVNLNIIGDFSTGVYNGYQYWVSDDYTINVYSITDFFSPTLNNDILSEPTLIKIEFKN